MGNEGSSVGKIIGGVVLAGVCATVGWVGNSMWSEHQKQAQAKQGAAAAAAQAAAAPTVSLHTVEEAEYNLPERYVAHVEAQQEVDLLPQVDGYIKEILFKEGDIVQAGQTLYVLDDEKYQAVVGQAKADLNAAETEERRARRYFERMQKADERGITQKERDDAEAGAERAKAAVMQAKANLVVAEYNCKKAKVVAPIAGQIGKTTAHLGDYVAPSKGALAKIVQTDPIRVSFPMTDRAYVGWRMAAKRGQAPDLRMRLMLPDGSEYDQQGNWDFDDNQMSRETATIMMRLSFPNPDRLLVPNSYVSLLTDSKVPPKYPLVPQAAIIDLAGGAVGVYVYNEANGTVVATPIETLPAEKGMIPAVKGLAAGTKIVAAGTRKLRSGMKVDFATATSTEENTPGWKGKEL